MIDIYEIEHGSIIHQEQVYIDMINYCAENNLDTSNIITKNVEIPIQEINYLRISDYIPNGNNSFFSNTYNPLSKEDLEKIDYDLKGYHKKRTFIFGELKVVEYYKNYDLFTNTYSELVVKEERKYIRDTNTGLCYARQMNIYWYLNNDQVGNSIINRMKYFSFAESMQELKDRRTNLFSDAESLMLYFLSQNFSASETMIKAVQLKQAIKNDKELYIDGVAENIINIISSENNIIDTVFIDSNLANFVKQQLLSILSYNFTAQVE